MFSTKKQFLPWSWVFWGQSTGWIFLIFHDLCFFFHLPSVGGRALGHLGRPAPALATLAWTSLSTTSIMYLFTTYSMNIYMHRPWIWWKAWGIGWQWVHPLKEISNSLGDQVYMFTYVYTQTLKRRIICVSSRPWSSHCSIGLLAPPRSQCAKWQ